jgi:hypothetical protein
VSRKPGTKHPFSFDCFDSHIHWAYSPYPNRLKRPEIQQVIDSWFRMTGVYRSGRAMLMDPYLETMEYGAVEGRLPAAMERFGDDRNPALSNSR